MADNGASHLSTHAWNAEAAEIAEKPFEISLRALRTLRSNGVFYRL